MTVQDIRWHQRFQNYNTKALQQMDRFFQQEQLNELEEQGLINAFEYTYELSWHRLRDYMPISRGIPNSMAHAILSERSLI